MTASQLSLPLAPATLEHLRTLNASTCRVLTGKHDAGSDLGGLRSDGASEKERSALDADELTVTDISNKDEALKLVGLQRTEDFSDEDYQRVRRKLVCTLRAKDLFSLKSTDIRISSFRHCVQQSTVLSTCM